MTRAELLEVLAVERHSPSPRPPRFTRCDPPRPLTEQEQAENRRLMLENFGDDAVVIAFNGRKAG